MVNQAEGDASRFLSVYAEYAKAPDITRERLYLETMERVLGGVNKVVLDKAITGTGGVLPYLPLDGVSRSLPPDPAAANATGGQN